MAPDPADGRRPGGSTIVAVLEELRSVLPDAPEVVGWSIDWAVAPHGERYHLLACCLAVPPHSERPLGFRYLRPRGSRENPPRAVDVERQWFCLLSPTDGAFRTLREADLPAGALEIRLIAVCRVVDLARPQPLGIIRWNDGGRYRMSIVNFYDENTREDVDAQWRALRVVLDGYAPVGRPARSGMLTNLSADALRTILRKLRHKHAQAGLAAPDKADLCAELAERLGREHVSERALELRLRDFGLTFSQL